MIRSDSETIWVQTDRKRFIVLADEKLAAFVEMEAATAAVERPARIRARRQESKNSPKRPRKEKLDASFHAAVK